jgi:hypothetical protein
MVTKAHARTGVHVVTYTVSPGPESRWEWVSWTCLPPDAARSLGREGCRQRRGVITSVEAASVLTPAARVEVRGAARVLVPVFAGASFLSATLLFLVQPMAAKLLLPVFGGGPSVWNTSMVFFQVTLLAGYAYAHVATTRLSRRTHLGIHLAVLSAALLVLPFHVPHLASGTSESPAPLLLVALTIMVGAPFFLLSTMAPVLQRWFAWSDHPRAHDPYFLYAAGNAGSVLGLLSYPFLIEPLLDLRSQAVLWMGGYVLLVLVSVAAGGVVLRFRPVAASIGIAAVKPTRLQRRRVVAWVGWTSVPSALMLAATAYITTDIAPVPLLWVVPLTVYLATYIVAFSKLGSRMIRPSTLAACGLALLAALDMTGAFALPVALSVVAHIALLGAVGVAFHGHLVADRPPAEHLTRFYLAMSVGGALGGAFVALVAPLLFPVLLEYGLLLIAALVVLERKTPSLVGGTPTTRVLGFVAVVVLLVGALLAAHAVPGAAFVFAAVATAIVASTRLRNVVAVGVLVISVGASAYLATSSLHVDRTFFGVHRVVVDGDTHQLAHGSTIHGVQRMTAEGREVPLSYYHPDGPLGDVVRVARGTGGSLDVGALGLGTGAVAAYGEAGDRVVFYEIDPAVVAIAEDPSLFTYLSDSAAEIDIVLGDGRLTLEASGARHDVLIVDAFSSDAIPVHLLTREAIALYRERVSDNGLVALHVSNRNLDLAPVVAAIAEHDGILGWTRSDEGEGAAATGRTASNWIVLSGTPGAGDAFEGWTELSGSTTKRTMWTDAHSDVLRVLRRGN